MSRCVTSVTQLICVLTAMLLTAAGGADGLSCNWSNEGCSKDSDCCSKSCFQRHVGTNPRCRHSSLSEPCVFDHHCAEGLECGTHRNCCSPFWHSCSKTTDCCDSEHICRPVEGFIYDRCLYPSSARTSFPLNHCSLLLLPLIHSTLNTGVASETSLFLGYGYHIIGSSVWSPAVLSSIFEYESDRRFLNVKYFLSSILLIFTVIIVIKSFRKLYSMWRYDLFI